MRVTDSVALAAMALLLLTMPVFAVVARGRPLDMDVARRPATTLLGYWVRDWAMWVIAPLERAFIQMRVAPDVFNWLGVAFGVLAGVAFAFGELSLAAWCIVFGGAADIFDGRVARARAIVSERGAFMDSTLDRFAEVLTFVGVTVYFASRPLLLSAAALALGGSMLVSYVRARGEALRVSLQTGTMQRAERLVLLALGALLDTPVAGWFAWAPGTFLGLLVGVIGVGAFGTALYRTLKISQTLGNR